MEIIKEISDGAPNEDTETRNTVRGIFFDDEDLIPIMYIKKHNMHKLPGGGIEKGEDILDALEREFKEETGCVIRAKGMLLGVIDEYRKEYNLRQISKCYYGRILAKGIPSLTEEEIELGLSLKWMPLHVAIETIENDTPIDYAGKFIKERELEFLKTFQKGNYYFTK